MNKYQKELLQHALNDEKQVLNDLRKTYEQAEKDIDKKIEELMGRIQATEDENLMQSTIYQRDMQLALKKQISGILDDLNGNEFNTISEYISKSYENGFIGAIYDMQGQGVPLVFPIDQEQVTTAVVRNSKLSKSLYSSLGEDVAELKKRVQSELSRGIAQNYSYSQIARLIKNQTKIGYNKAIRIARTEGHRVQQAAQADAQLKAKDAGADVVKQWDATLDGRTRPSHRQLDGQIKEIDEPFETSGYKAQYPGDFGIPSMDVNCRCSTLTRARWALDDDITKWDNVTGTLLTVEAKNYSDFKEKYGEVIQNYSYGNYKNKKTVKDYLKTDTDDAQPGDSLSKYLDKDGNLNAERENLHQKIIDDFFEGALKADGQQTFTIMGGGPASGKSTVVKNGTVTFPDGSIVIDSDNIKGKLPEYKTLVDMKYVKAVNGQTVAGYVHEESSALAKRIMSIANNENYNYVLDGTGDGSVSSLTKKIKQAKEKGARVVGRYVTVPTEVAVKRAVERGLKTGRIIDPNVITGTHRKVSQILPECAHLFDDVELYDTTGDAILIATGGNGKPLSAVPGQEKLFEEFLKKGK